MTSWFKSTALSTQICATCLTESRTFIRTISFSLYLYVQLFPIFFLWIYTSLFFLLLYLEPTELLLNLVSYWFEKHNGVTGWPGICCGIYFWILHNKRHSLFAGSWVISKQKSVTDVLVGQSINRFVKIPTAFLSL